MDHFAAGVGGAEVSPGTEQEGFGLSDFISVKPGDETVPWSIFNRWGSGAQTLSERTGTGPVPTLLAPRSPVMACGDVDWIHPAAGLPVTQGHRHLGGRRACGASDLRPEGRCSYTSNVRRPTAWRTAKSVTMPTT